MKMFPDVPTLQELGYDYVNDTMFFVVAPKGTPPSIIKKLEDVFRKAMGDPEFIQVLAKFDAEDSYRNSEDAKRFLEESYVRFGKLIIQLNIPKETEKK